MIPLSPVLLIHQAVSSSAGKYCLHTSSENDDNGCILYNLSSMIIKTYIAIQWINLA